MKERREAFDFVRKQLASRLDLCLWPATNCRNQAIRAHSVQNRNVLERLCRNGHVVMPRIEVTYSQPPAFFFREVGRNKATTFTGLCSEHDHALFQPIELDVLDLKSAKHLLLLANRAVLREAHATRKTAIDTQLAYEHGIDKGLYPKDEPSAPGMLAIEQMTAAYLVDDVRQRVNAAFLSGTWDGVGHQVIEIDTAPSVAVNAMFSTRLYSDETDGPAFVTLNVLPVGSTTAVVFSYLLEHRPMVLEAFGHIWAASGHYQQYELSKLILRKCENFVLAPVLYDSYSERQKKAVAEYFERNTFGQSYEKEDPYLFLFSPIPEPQGV